MKKLLKFLLNWNELLTLPLAVLLWYLSPVILRAMDPTAATYDAGIFQVLLFAVISVFIFHALAWLMLKWTFPAAYKKLDQLLEGQTTLTEFEQIKVVLALFALYMAAFLLAARVL